MFRSNRRSGYLRQHPEAVRQLATGITGVIDGISECRGNGDKATKTLAEAIADLDKYDLDAAKTLPEFTPRSRRSSRRRAESKLQ
jgi:hypothetical protein